MVLVFFLLNRKYHMFKIDNRDRQIWKTFKQEISAHERIANQEASNVI